jgi:hypothetical protein
MSPKHGPGAAGVAAQQGPHPRLELVEVERLDQVVVGALVQPEDPVAGGVAGGQHQHPGRLAGVVGPDAPDHLDAVEAGQVQVQADHVVVVDAHLVDRLLAVVGDVDGVALPTQAARDRVGQVGLILDDQHPHA